MGNFEKNFQPVEFDPFAGPEISRVAPAIEPQLEIWASCIIGGADANRAYNESVSLLLSGPFNHAAMESAFQDLIDRHEGLRSVFNEDGSQICIFKTLPPKLVYEDLSSQSSSDQQKFISDFAKQDRETSFDLLNGPLFRSALFKLKEEEHYLTITAHHIICDGWSLGILMQDLSKLYSAYAKHETPSLPEAYRFSQYAVDYWEFSQSNEYKKIEQYWIDQYKDNVPLLSLPIDFSRSSIRTYKSQRDDFAIDLGLVAAVKKMGAKAGCSFVTTLLAAFEVLLHRITGQEDIVLGLPAAGQSSTGHYALIGHCVHLLPLRSNPHGELTFTEYLKQRKAKIFSDYDHQEFTFGSLLKKLNIPRDPSRIPLVPVAFNIDMGLDDGVAFQDLKHKLIYNPRSYENFEIFLNATGSEQSLVLEWSYNTQLFKPESIKLRMDNFESLLHAVVDQPEIKIKDIFLLQKQEIKYSEQALQYPKDKTIVDLFLEQTEKTPDKVAVVFGNDKWSYRELNEKSNQLAHYLIKKGVSTESLVPICIERSLEIIIGILGILKAGGAYVPIDPEYPAERINFMLEDTGNNIILSSRACSDKFKEVRSRIIVMENEWGNISRENVTAPKSVITPSNLAYVIYTSGSTGRPKGAMIEHKNVVSLVKGVDYVTLTPKDILLSTGSPSFDATTFEYWGMLLNGGQLVMCSEQTLLDIGLLKKEIQSRNVNIIWFTSSLLNQWVDMDITVFEGLQTILAGGEKLSEKHIEKLRNAHPTIAIINGYGPTENTTFSLTYPITAKKITNAIPIGRPLTNRFAYVLNQERELCLPETVGELYVGGAGVGRGYLNLPELTKEKFIADPFSKEPSATMYRTGDLARCLTDGNIEYMGRIDDQVKIRGFRIELGEIESVLQQYAGVRHCVVITKEDKQGEKRLIAYVVPEGTFNRENIAAYLESKLPAYMVPRILIEMDKIPLTSNGKADRKALPDPEQQADPGKKKNKMPINANQKLVADIWAEALGLQQVGIHDDFFELGGHSLIAIKVMKRLEEKTGQYLPVTSLFEAPTVEKFSLMLHLSKEAISWKSLVPIKPSGSKPPLYIVHGSGLTVLVFNSLAKGLDPDQPVYGLQARGLNGEEPFEKMEDIAAYYISEILENNPNGPYCLAGYSFGGIVAFEMAKQFTAMGKEVKMLAIFDTYADNSDYIVPWGIKMKRKVRRQFPKMRFILRSLNKHPKETLLYQAKFFRDRFSDLFTWIGLPIKRHSEEEALSVYANKINEKHDLAYHNYIMSPYNGVVDLFRVNTRLYYLDDKIYLGWKPYALMGVHVHEIPGDHKTFLLAPNYKELAKILQKCIDERTGTKEILKGYSRENTILKAI